MYAQRPDLKDRTGAIVAVIAIHALIVLALLNLSGTVTLAEDQPALDIFDLREIVPPPPEPPPPPPPVEQQQRQRPKGEEAAASPANIRSQATPIVAPKPRIEPPIPLPINASETPNQGAAPTQGAADVRGIGTGAGGTGTGTGSGGSGGGGGGGGDGGVAEPPRLLTPVLRGRDFPPSLLDSWPRGAQVFLRFRIDPAGRVSECFVDRGTGDPAIDSQICGLAQRNFRYRPALTRSGRAVAGWAGYRQTPPR